ncbi:MAG TPA: ABC transporter permease [Vicinamibacterales bacterium]|nr:ABC transporter permease [Vicinamibacterales bacterium]
MPSTLIAMLIQDLRYGLRRIKRQPAFTALVAVTLAVGVGANAAMFGLVDVLMFRTPRHVAAPEAIVRVEGAGSYVRYEDLRDRLRSAELAAYTRRSVGFGAGVEAMPLRIECVTPTYFRVLGMTPQYGRTFAEADASLDADRTVVVSHDLWRRRFNADLNAVGTRVRIADKSYDVIGVAPAGFTGVEFGDVDAWILLEASPEACSPFARNLLRSDTRWLTTIGRLRDGVPLSQAQAELASLALASPVAPAASGRSNDRDRLTPMYASRRVSLSRDGRLALWLMGGAAVLLLMACVNVAGLLWTQTLNRARETAVRLQVGASRVRVFAHLLVEHLIAAAIGGVAAVAVAAVLGRAVHRYFPYAEGVELMTLRSLVVVGLLAFLAGLASGIVPVVHASRTGAERFFRTGDSLAAMRSRWRATLLSLQIALALVLAVAAGLFVASVRKFHQDFSYDLEHVIAASIDLRTSNTRTPLEVQGLFETLLRRVQQMPQVQSAALSSAPVLESGGWSRIFGVSRTITGRQVTMHKLVEVTPEYFSTLGLSLSGGPGFDGQAAAASEDTIVLEDIVARQLFPSESPLGQCVFVSRRCLKVAGVVPTSRASLKPGSQTSQVFVPFRASSDIETTAQVLLIRTRRPAASQLRAVSGVLQGAAPDLPYVNIRTLEELADVQARSWLLGSTVFGIFGTLAMLLGAIGIYGALASTIRQRTAEIGLRLALGAARGDIARMIVRHAALAVLSGLVAGLGASFAGARYIQALLFNVPAVHATTYAAAPMVVLFAALLACVVPVRRAMCVDPAIALRRE